MADGKWVMTEDDARRVDLSHEEQNITDLTQAQQTKQVVISKAPEQKQEFMTHSFSSEELNALFDNLDEVKL